MLRKIARIANKLDSLGMTKEADYLDSFISKDSSASKEWSLPKQGSDSLPNDIIGIEKSTSFFSIWVLGFLLTFFIPINSI